MIAAISILLLGVVPIEESRAFPVDAHFVSKTLEARTGIKNLEWKVFSTTEAIPGDYTSVSATGHSLGVYGSMEKADELFLGMFSEKNGILTISTWMGVKGNSSIVIDINKGLVLRNKMTPGFETTLQEIKESLDAYRQYYNSLRSLPYEKAKLGIEAFGISVDLTAEFVGTALACGLSAGWVCSAAVIATISCSARNMIRLSDRVERVAIEERREQEWKNRPEPVSPGPYGADHHFCPPGHSCTPLYEGMGPVGPIDPFHDSESSSYWMDTDGDGEDDTCVITAGRE
jgi:hypothetical protein